MSVEIRRLLKSYGTDCTRGRILRQLALPLRIHHRLRPILQRKQPFHPSHLAPVSQTPQLIQGLQ